jgi:molybdate transport system substrate-binding protein
MSSFQFRSVVISPTLCTLSGMKRVVRSQHIPLRHLLVASIALLVSCSLDARTKTKQETLTVYAAASLSSAFAEVAAAYESEHTGVTVRLNYAGSQQLAQQLAQGAPADVFASASAEQMRVAHESGRVTGNTDAIFATNRLVVITPPGEAALETLSDLARPGARVILADATVPAGQYARTFLQQASNVAALGNNYEKRVLANVVSYERNVRAVLTKVALGEADAGVVYESDASASDVGRIPIPDELNVVASYPVAPVNDSTNARLATSFVEFVLSPAGQAILQRHGFGGVLGTVP